MQIKCVAKVKKQIGLEKSYYLPTTLPYPTQHSRTHFSVWTAANKQVGF